MRYCVTGCAGFIGSTLVDRLLEAGHSVVGVDNFSTGQKLFLQSALACKQFSCVVGDVFDEMLLREALRGCDAVFHFAANADVRWGTSHPEKDLQQNTCATFAVLEAMRAEQVKKIIFASTGSVYGEASVFPTPENAPFPIQTSLYGASKLACEALISAYCTGFGFQAYIFRFVSVLGERYTHGHIIDFYTQLKKHPEKLYVLGDGTQRKSYLYIQDCIDAIFCAMENANDPINLFNLGTDDYCDVQQSIAWITQTLALNPRIIYAGGDRGWAGDNPFIFLDCRKIQQLGWHARHSIRTSVIKTVRYLQQAFIETGCVI